MMLAARVGDCNQAFARLYGASEPAQLIGSRFVSLMGMTSETLIERTLRFVRSGYCIDGVHNRETLHDGTVRHFINTSRGEIQDGHVVRAWITGVDVTFKTLIEANYFGLQRRGGSGNRSVLNVRLKGNAGQPLSSRFYA